MTPQSSTPVNHRAFLGVHCKAFCVSFGHFYRAISNQANFHWKSAQIIFHLTLVTAVTETGILSVADDEIQNNSEESKSELEERRIHVQQENCYKSYLKYLLKI